jgi:cyclic pyranopterin phosphate synthase
MSVTDRCNFNCYFCHNEGQPKTITANTPEFLTPADYGWISKLAFDYGFRKFKITGGEPTLRQDLSEIISQIKAAGVQDLSMITNGARLKFVSAMLKKAGLGRVNVSLYSLNPKTFLRNQRVSSRFVSEVREGIDACWRLCKCA